MSLVERALKKLQDSRTAQASEQPRDIVIGSVVSTSRARPDFQPATHAPAATYTPAAAPAVSPAPLPRSDKLVVVNRDALRTAGLMPTTQQERKLGSEYRHIKRPLIAAATGKGAAKLPDGQAIMVASALPGEGKTFTSINLALSMALEKDLSVVLVDADVAKPHISRIFGVDKEPGLLDVLLDETLDVDSTIIPTDIPRLGVLPAGRHADTATELLASQHMRQVVSTLLTRNPNRIVLFDSPPLLLTSESRALASAVGQIVIVVRAASTARQAIHDALESLGSNKETKSIGLILNQAEADSSDVHYGYGEYYRRTESE